DLQRMLTNHGVEPRNLVLEITENVLIVDEAQAAETVRELGELGIAMAIDDPARALAEPRRRGRGRRDAGRDLAPDRARLRHGPGLRLCQAARRRRARRLGARARRLAGHEPPA